jgi:hypothetical protein
MWTTEADGPLSASGLSTKCNKTLGYSGLVCDRMSLHARSKVITNSYKRTRLAFVTSTSTLPACRRISPITPKVHGVLSGRAGALVDTHTLPVHVIHGMLLRLRNQGKNTASMQYLVPHPFSDPSSELIPLPLVHVWAVD